MFSIREKQEIAEKVQQALRATNHPELPDGEISFKLHVYGKESWSWADIENNDTYSKDNPTTTTDWNESQDKK